MQKWNQKIVCKLLYSEISLVFFLLKMKSWKKNLHGEACPYILDGLNCPSHKESSYQNGQFRPSKCIDLNVMYAILEINHFNFAHGRTSNSIFQRKTIHFDFNFVVLLIFCRISSFLYRFWWKKGVFF